MHASFAFKCTLSLYDTVMALLKVWDIVRTGNMLKLASVRCSFVGPGRQITPRCEVEDLLSLGAATR
jgi:hypothetical protein